MDINLISHAESSTIIKAIKKSSVKTLSLPNFRGKQLLHELFSRLFDSNYNGWAKVDKVKLGN